MFHAKKKKNHIHIWIFTTANSLFYNILLLSLPIRCIILHIIIPVVSTKTRHSSKTIHVIFVVIFFSINYGWISTFSGSRCSLFIFLCVNSKIINDCLRIPLSDQRLISEGGRILYLV